jgi:hypothetical protein
MNLFESRVRQLLGTASKEFQDELRASRIKRACELYEWATNDDQNIIKQLQDRLRSCQLIEEDTFKRFPTWNYINGIPKILNIMCTLYHKPPTRYVVVNGEIDEQATDLLYKYIEKTNINEACNEALKLAWLYKVSRVMPTIRNNKLNYDILLPMQVEIETAEDDPFLVKQLGILSESWNLTNNKMERYIIVWNEKEHYILDHNLNIISVQKDGKDNNYINPYGIIPIGTLWLETTDAWGDPQYKLVEHYASNSLKNIWKDYNSYFHIGGIPVLSNLDLGSKRKLTNSNDTPPRTAKIKSGNDTVPITFNNNEPKFKVTPDTILYLNSELEKAPANFQFATPTSNLELLQNLIDWDTKKNLSDYNIPKNAFSTDVTPESGYSKMVGEMEAINARKRHLLPCIAFENELFDVLKVILKYNFDIDFPKGSTLKIDYSEYEYVKSPAEIAQEMEVNIKYNVKSPIDYIIQDNPELSEEEAEDIYNYNLEMNAKLTNNNSKPISLDFGNENNDFESESENENEIETENNIIDLPTDEE